MREMKIVELNGWVKYQIIGEFGELKISLSYVMKKL